MARHIALTGCKLECRKTGGGGPRACIAISAEEATKRLSSGFLEDMDVPSFLPTLCILVSYYRVCTAQDGKIFTHHFYLTFHEISYDFTTRSAALPRGKLYEYYD